MVLQRASARSPTCAEDPTGSRNGCFDPNHSSAPFRRGRHLKTAAATSPRCALFLRSAPGEMREEAPPSTWAPAPSTPRACTERDLLAETRCPPSILTRSDLANEAGRGGAGLSGRRLPEVRATCALTARTPNPASPAAASAARRSRLPALGRGLLLGRCLDVGSHPLSAQRPEARVAHSPRLLPGPAEREAQRRPDLRWMPGGVFRDGRGRGDRPELARDPGSVRPGVLGRVSWPRSSARPRLLDSRFRPPFP